jgi:predicted DNA-binding protein
MSTTRRRDQRVRCRPGRPPAGRDEHGRAVPVSTAYRQTTIRLSPVAKATLDAIAVLQRRDRSTIVQEAIDALLAGLPAADRDAIHRLRDRIRDREG